MLKTSRIHRAFADQANIITSIAGGTKQYFIFETPAGVRLGLAHSDSEACAWFRGWLAAHGTIVGNPGA
jgi:hypothetical protein